MIGVIFLKVTTAVPGPQQVCQLILSKTTRRVLPKECYVVCISKQAQPAQAKLVRVTEGEVLDVVVDIREHSATRGQWYSMRLSAENKRQLFVPRGFAHGYLVLSEQAEFAYKCDNYYSKAHEHGIRFDDPGLRIDWEFDLSKVLVSEKDLALPYYKG